MNAFSLIVLVLASVGCIHAQNEPKCLNPGAILEDQQTAKLCYGANQASIVKLHCNWDKDAFQFELEVKPDAESKEIVFRREAVGYSSPSQGRIDLPEIATGDRACPVQRPPFVQAYSFLTQPLTPAVNMEIRDGDLYYETTVVISEYRYVDDKCTRARFFITDVRLSCCAKPRETPREVVPVPLHRYCTLIICTDNADVECTCVQGTGAHADQWKITATHLNSFGSLGANVDWELLEAETYDSALGRIGADVLPIIREAGYEPIPSALEFSSQARISRGAPYVMHINPHDFHQTHNNGVSVSCTPTYCVNSRSQGLAPSLNRLPDCVNARSVTGR